MCPLRSNTVVKEQPLTTYLIFERREIVKSRKLVKIESKTILATYKCQLDGIFSQSSPSRSLPRYFRFFSENIVIILRNLSWDNIIVQNKLELIILSQH